MTRRLFAILLLVVLATPTAGLARPGQRVVRDALTRRHFNGKVKVQLSSRKDVGATSRALFGRALRTRDFARLVGAPDGATVTVLPRVKQAGKQQERYFKITVNHPLFRETQERFVYREAGKRGGLVIKNEFTALKEEAQGQGLGTRMLAHQVAAARRLGVKKIVLDGGGSAWQKDRLNGYYTWPRLGFNAPMGGDLRRYLPASMKGTRDITGVMSTAAGRAWWRDNGETTRMTFSVAPNSTSSRVLRSYMQDRGVEIGK